MGELGGMRAIVTGGSSGIGLATAEMFHAKGAKVAVLDVNTESVASHFFPITADVRDSESVSEAVNAAGEHMGGVDLLVNNAGISCVGTVDVSTDDDWRRVFDINVFGVARVSRATVPWLRRSDSASIVNVCSIGAMNGLPERAVYSSSKGAVLSLTYSMATDHVREGIRVNAVSPGTVATPFVDRMLQTFEDPVAERAALDARQATGRMVTPQEVAHAIVYLSSPRALSTTGTALEVDGGVTHLRVRPLEH